MLNLTRWQQIMSTLAPVAHAAHSAVVCLSATIVCLSAMHAGGKLHRHAPAGRYRISIPHSACSCQPSAIRG